MSIASISAAVVLAALLPSCQGLTYGKAVRAQATSSPATPRDPSLGAPWASCPSPAAVGSPTYDDCVRRLSRESGIGGSGMEGIGDECTQPIPAANRAALKRCGVSAPLRPVP